MDGLDADVGSSVPSERANPDVIVHQMTALTGMKVWARSTASSRLTNRLRTEGTREPHRRRDRDAPSEFYRDVVRGLAVRPQPADRSRPRATRSTPSRRRASARDPCRDPDARGSSPSRAGGIVLRYGGFYGPGTGWLPTASRAELIRRRKFPIVGSGTAIWSIAARRGPGHRHAGRHRARPAGRVYNVVRRRPRAGSTSGCRSWPGRPRGPPPPRKVPAFLARLVAGPAAVTMMTESRGASNAKAKAGAPVGSPGHTTGESWDPRVAGTKAQSGKTGSLLPM